MLKSRFSPEQIKAVLLEIATGCSVRNVSQKYGVSTTTLYRWRARFPDKGQSTRERLRLLEIENRRLKSKFAELALDYTSLRTALVRDIKREC